MIKLVKVSKSFSGKTLWNDVDWEFQPGTMTALVGPSGCGKTTLLNCIGGLELPTSGEILTNGLSIGRLNKRQLRHFRRDTLGYLFQDYALIDNETALENTRIALPKGKSKREAIAALTKVGLGDRVSAKVCTLSGGEQQRVAMSRLLVRNPSIILADEPTGALDPENEKHILTMLRDFATDGATVVIATHSSNVIDTCDDVLKLPRIDGSLES